MSTFGSHQGETVIRMDILPPEPSRRTTRVNARRGEVVDAQFVPVRETFRRGPNRCSHNDNRSNRADPAIIAQPFAERIFAGIERGLMRLSADFFSAVVAVVFVTVFSLAGGFTFLFAGSATAEVGPTLDITHVTMTPQDANGMRVLLINGIVENRSGDNRAMPQIRAELMSGQTLIATTLISPPASSIEGGQSRGFSARVPHPGGKLPDLRLSFADRGA
ncbi:hypothetical protein NFO65_01815 [Neorhizobium galegae]|uniref:hypothetical protein n=1 Tax=Neorhizobium galegae TaxID=399 RepID=UPI0021009DE7|nr:hypothetical protein [Neorhizobium galegae]MCQ1569477.1 hypothetical protein [Neorhizobium galegae]